MTGIKDTMLVLSSYPDPTPEYIVDQAAGVAQRLGAGLCALMPVLERGRIAAGYPRHSLLLDVPALIDEALAASTGHADRLLARLEKAASRRDILRDQIRVKSSWAPSADTAVRHAHARDMIFLPVGELIGLDELYVEDVIFGSGRPCMILPARDEQGSPEAEIDNVVVAWDHSRAAARALADAMPILEQAKKVRVVTFSGEKDIADAPTDSDLDRHLKLHGVTAAFETVDAGRKSIGTALGDYIERHKANLLVMGAFGHSRLREFVLGGATRSVLKAPPVPVFLSH